MMFTPEFDPLQRFNPELYPDTFDKVDLFKHGIILDNFMNPNLGEIEVRLFKIGAFTPSFQKTINTLFGNVEEIALPFHKDKLVYIDKENVKTFLISHKFEFEAFREIMSSQYIKLGT